MLGEGTRGEKAEGAWRREYKRIGWPEAKGGKKGL